MPHIIFTRFEEADPWLIRVDGKEVCEAKDLDVSASDLDPLWDELDVLLTFEEAE